MYGFKSDEMKLVDGLETERLSEEDAITRAESFSAASLPKFVRTNG